MWRGIARWGLREAAEAALNAIAENLWKLDKAMLLDIETKAPGTVNNIEETAIIN